MHLKSEALPVIQAFLDQHAKTKLFAAGFIESAEYQLGIGNPACIELSADESKTGRVLEFTVPDECIGFDDDIEVLYDLIEGLSSSDALDFLSDGEALAYCGIYSKEAVETVYNAIKGAS